MVRGKLVGDVNSRKERAKDRVKCSVRSSKVGTLVS